MEEKLIEAFKEALELEDQEVSLEDSINDFDNWDSLSRLSLIAHLDEYYDIQVSDAELNDIETLKDLLVIIKTKTC